MSLAEFVIATGLMTTLMGMLAVEYVYFTRSFARLQNYMYMSGKSRYAMDRMSKEIRQADSIAAYATNKLTILRNGANISFTYDPVQRTLSRQSGSTNELYLAGCDYLRFDVFQRSTIANSYDLYPATNVTVAKVVQMDWVCSRKIMGAKANTESIQSSKVTLRKK